MNRKRARSRFVVCIHNEDFKASFEVGKIYRTIPDAKAAARQFIRVMDESGEDYLYPESWFLPIALPRAIEKALSLAS